MYCSELQCVAVYVALSDYLVVLRAFDSRVHLHVLRYVCCSVLQCVAVCCSVLQCALHSECALIGLFHGSLFEYDMCLPELCGHSLTQIAFIGFLVESLCTEKGLIW